MTDDHEGPADDERDRESPDSNPADPDESAPDGGAVAAGRRVDDAPAPVVEGDEPVADDAGEAFGGLLDPQFVGKTAAGFAVAGVLVYLLGWTVGWGEVLETLRETQLRWLAAACLSTAVGLAAWGKAWQVVLRVAGVEASYRRLVVTYFAATFANYVTPLGQAGGEPFIAYVLAADTEASYEDSLASVVTADLLNLLPFFNFAALGLGWLLLQVGLPEQAENLAVGLVAMALGVPALVYLGWRRRDAVERGVLAVVAPVARHTARVSVEGARRRIEEFYAALERIAADPRALAYALVFAYVGWAFFALPLYFAGRSLGFGAEIGVLLVLFVVPASTLAGLVPTPGGTGAVESALVVLLLPLTALGLGEALALALVYRIASYYFAILVGGVAALWVVVRT